MLGREITACDVVGFGRGLITGCGGAAAMTGTGFAGCRVFRLELVAATVSCCFALGFRIAAAERLCAGVPVTLDFNGFLAQAIRIMSQKCFAFLVPASAGSGQPGSTMSPSRSTASGRASVALVGSDRDGAESFFKSRIPLVDIRIVGNVAVCIRPGREIVEMDRKGCGQFDVGILTGRDGLVDPVSVPAQNIFGKLAWILHAYAAVAECPCRFGEEFLCGCVVHVNIV